jgi:biopolymer transport protein ExbD/biopolymer transport protein TolR
MKLSKLTFSIIFVLISAGLSCRYVMPERYATYNGGRVNVEVPNGVKNSEPDPYIDKDTSVVISLPDNEKLFIGKEQDPSPKANLAERLNQLLKDQKEDEKRVYIAASVLVDYGVVLEVCNHLREQNVSRVGLIANRLPLSHPSRFWLELPELRDPNEDLSKLKPNPFALVVSVRPDLKLKLNQEDMGSANDPEVLNTTLTQIFQRRLEQHAYRPGFASDSGIPESDLVEKTIIIKADRSMKYGDIVKVIDAVKGAGARPIMLQIDDLPRVPSTAYHSP